jgi:hypothetical protein
MTHAVSRVETSRVILTTRASPFFVVPASSLIVPALKSICLTRIESNSPFLNAKLFKLHR